MIIPVGYAHVVHAFEGSAAPSGAVCTYGVAPNGGSFNPGDAAILHGHFADNIMPQLTNDLTLVSTTMKYGPNDVGAVVIEADAVTGSVSDAGLPANCAYLVRKQTALGGRANRGRLYIPGVAETVVDESGALNSLNQTAMQAAVTQWLTDIESEVINMVILHGASSIPTEVTSLNVDSRIATQRRRLRR